MHDTTSILHGMRTHTRAHTHTTTILHRPTGSQQAYGLPTGLRAPNRPTGAQQAYRHQRKKRYRPSGFCSFVCWRLGPTGYDGKSGIALRASALLSASALSLRATERKSGIALRASALLSASALGLRTTGVGRVVTISDHTPHMAL